MTHSLRKQSISMAHGLGEQPVLVQREEKLLLHTGVVQGGEAGVRVGLQSLQPGPPPEPTSSSWVPPPKSSIASHAVPPMGRQMDKPRSLWRHFASKL